MIPFLSELAIWLGVQIHKLKDNWMIKLSTIISRVKLSVMREACSNKFICLKPGVILQD